MDFAFTLALIASSFLLVASTQSLHAADRPGDKPLIMRFPNNAIFQSPYTWRNADGSAIAPTGGAYLKGVVSGTRSIKANVDTSINAGLAANDMPTLKVTVDDEPAAFVQFPPGAKHVTLASVSPAQHRYRLEVIGGNQGVGDGWGGTSFQTKVDSLEFDNGATLSAPAVRPKRALILGDSNIQAYFGERSDEPYYKYVDYTLSWPGYVAAAFDCEFGLVGVGSTGWTHPGQGGYPAMPAWWEKYDAGHPRDLSLQPDYVWVALGANDHNSDPAKLQKIIQDWLTFARKTFPAAEVFVVSPFHGENREPVTAAVAAQADAKVHLVDLGTEIQSAIPFVIGHPTWMTGDGLHIRAVYHGIVAAGIARQSQKALHGVRSEKARD